MHARRLYSGMSRPNDLSVNLCVVVQKYEIILCNQWCLAEGVSVSARPPLSAHRMIFSV
jgi:hypothetical protein